VYFELLVCIMARRSNSRRKRDEANLEQDDEEGDVAHEDATIVRKKGRPKPKSHYAFEPELVGEYPNLVRFIGGLATPFTSTATNEADFSRLKFTKNNHRTCLADASLEGSLQCFQWEELNSITP
jgi:hypothetical protein